MDKHLDQKLFSENAENKSSEQSRKQQNEGMAYCMSSN